MAAKGLTRKITRKQARSYERLTPNGIGVTTIAAISNPGKPRRSKSKKARPNSALLGVLAGITNANPRSEYSKRYSATKALLKRSSKGAKGEAMKANRKRLKGAAFKKTAQYKKMMAGLARYQKGSSKKGGKRRARRNPFETGYVGSSEFQTTGAKGYDLADKPSRLPGSKRKTARKTGAKKSTGSAVKKMNAEAAKLKRLKNLAKARAARKRAAASAKRAAAEKKKVGKVYGKKYKSLKATIGGRAKPTYAYSRKGKPAKIPLWAILGAKSKKDLERRVASDPKMARRVVATKKRRDRKASRLQAHGDIFTPNKKAVSFSQWSKKMAKPKKRKKSGGKKRRTAAQKAATRKMIAAAARKRRKSPSKKRGAAKRKAAPKRRRSTAKRAAKRTTKKTTHRRRKSTAKAAPKRRRSSRKSSKRTASKRISISKLRGKSRRRVARVLNKSKLKKYGRFYNENKRRHHKKRKHHSRRRHYRRNGVMEQLKSVFETGAIVTAGFLVHRLGTALVGDKVLASVDVFNTGSLAPYRKVIAGAIVAAAEIVLATKAVPKHAMKIGAGAVTSLLQNVLVTVLSQAGQTDAAGYLAGYPDAEGKTYRYLTGGGYNGYGEYLQMNGMGEYLQMNGFGAVPQFAQAAAGFEQAAAGFEQAAAGVGEYITTGLRGIGEYEQAAAGVGGMGSSYLEGIAPNTDSAEYALTMAENMSGIGDIGYQSRVTPTIDGQSIADAPTGDRAGILQGAGGIFG